MCFSGGSDSKESACNVGDPVSISGLGRSPGEGNGYTLQYTCLENSMDSPWGPKASDMTEKLTLSLHLALVVGQYKRLHLESMVS